MVLMMSAAVSEENDGGMSYQCIVVVALKCFSKTEQGLRRFEKHLNALADFVEPYNFFIAKSGILAEER